MCLLLFISKPLLAQTVKTAEQQLLENDAEFITLEDDINATNQYIATKWDQMNRTVDMYFTNQNSKQTENRSSIFVYSSFYKKEGQSIDTEYDFQLKIDLPNTTKKLKIIIEKQQDEITNALSDNSVSNNKTASQESHYTAGANFLLKQTKTVSSYLNFGIRLDMPLNPFTKFEIQKIFKPKWAQIALSQKVIYYRQEGIQEISQLTFTRKINNNLQADFINSLVWEDVNDLLRLRNNVILTQIVGEEKTLSYSIGANARFSPATYYESYDASVSYKQLMYNTWLYGTWTLGADFPKVSQFQDEKFVQFRVDIFFKE